MDQSRRQLLRTTVALACGTLLPPVAGSAPAGATASAQPSAEGAQVRLIAGPAGSDGVVRAGLEIRLADGWKTYWRYPGDSGVPPRFNWSGSTNVADVTVLWPAPKRFPDGAGGVSVGYKDTVVFPLDVRLKTPGAPAELDLALDFAVCQNLCVPADAHVAVTLPATGTEDPKLVASRAHVPVPTPLGAMEGPSLLGLTNDGSTKPARLIITARTSPGAMLFLEGPDDSWALPLPEPLDRQGDIQRFSVPLLGVPSDTPLPGARLTLTLVDGTRAIETQAPLPEPGKTP